VIAVDSPPRKYTEDKAARNPPPVRTKQLLQEEQESQQRIESEQHRIFALSRAWKLECGRDPSGSRKMVVLRRSNT